MPDISFLLASEPGWRHNRPGARYHLAESAQSWIYEAGSLTRRLRERYQDAFRVEVLFHRRNRPFFSESRLLDLPGHRNALIREVLLAAGDKPLILARTVIPAETLKGAQRSLSRLGSRPLGEVIFSYPDLQRLEMDIACVAASNWSPRLQRKVPIPEPVWGRRTVYAVAGRELLVNEFFLPDLLAGTA
ncbi:MAG: chorismate--pyruvate lyase family protein [Gammaproteobacteria bacterium]